MPSQSPARQPVIVLLTAALGLTVALLSLDLIEYAYERIGIDSRYLFTLLALSCSAATSTSRSSASAPASGPAATCWPSTSAAP
ncbi:MAG: hypothetical protein U0802_12305 [Candidatus Binatia bacterium]